MPQDFLRVPLGKLGTPVCRIGFSATYRPGRKTVFRALDAGLNYFHYYGFDTQTTSVLREVIVGRRERYVLATGAYNFIWWAQDLRRTLERRLRQMGPDYIDVFHFLGVTRPADLTPKVREQMQAIRESGLVRAVGISTHDRTFGAELLRDGVIDSGMVRYNAAHRGAESEVFERLPESNPAVISFTATRWRSLLRPPRRYPVGGRLPDAGMCYRFVLSNPAVHVCLMAPSNERQLEANLAAVRQGPLETEELAFMRSFGDLVYRERK